MKKIFFITFIVFVLLQLINIFGHFLIFDRTSYEPLFGIHSFFPVLTHPWLNFDGKNYLEIALFGYTLNRELSAFYPVYPIIIRFFSFNLINPIFVGLSISFVNTIFSIYLLYTLIEKKYNHKIAFRTCLLLITFPSSFYLISFYTESTFLLLTLLTFYNLEKKKYFYASFFCSIATATRIFGFALIPAVLYETYTHYQKTGKISFSFLISPIGFILYAFYDYLNFKNPFFMIASQTATRFGRVFDPLSPIDIYKNGLLKVIEGLHSSFDTPFVYPNIVLEFIAGIYLLIVVFLTFKKTDRSYFIYTAGSALIILYTGSLSSILRFLLPIFPIYLALGVSFSKSAIIKYISITSAILILASSIYFRNYWVA